jgi:hypothetical protein
VTNHGAARVGLTFAPAYSPYTVVSDATFDGRPLTIRRIENRTDWNASVDATIPEGDSTIRLRHAKRFGLAVPVDAPEPGLGSSNMKLVSEQWKSGGKQLVVELSGRGGRRYEIPVVGSTFIAGLSGCERSGDRLLVTMPSGAGYTHARLQVDLQ